MNCTGDKDVTRHKSEAGGSAACAFVCAGLRLKISQREASSNMSDKLRRKRAVTVETELRAIALISWCV